MSVVPAGAVGYLGLVNVPDSLQDFRGSGVGEGPCGKWSQLKTLPSLLPILAVRVRCFS
jgi:hypothetical protein